MTSKEKYRKLCEAESSMPIYSRAWWLDAVAPGAWDVVTVEKNEKIVAALPYVTAKKYGFTRIVMPPLTQKLGPWLSYPAGQKYSKKLDYEKKIFNELIEKLPMVDAFNQNFDYRIENWLPFYWQGFSQSTRYTYVLDDLSDMEVIEKGFAHAKRQNIKKALDSSLTVKFDLSAKAFYQHHQMTLGKQNLYDKSVSYSFELFQRIYDACYAHNAGRTIYAEDVDGHIQAALFVIWDENSAYDLISTIDPDYRKYGAATLLVWEMIKFVADKTKRFDFEGSMIEGVENSFRKFGAKQYPYFNISKIYNKRLKGLHHLKEVLRILRGRN